MWSTENVDLIQERLEQERLEQERKRLEALLQIVCCLQVMLRIQIEASCAAGASGGRKTPQGGRIVDETRS